jgi:hypothetical protein
MLICPKVIIVDLQEFYFDPPPDTIQLTPPPPAPVPHRQSMNEAQITSPLKQETDIHTALKDIRTSLQKSKAMNADNSPTAVYTSNSAMVHNIPSYYERTPAIPEKVESPAMSLSPVWIPR